MNLPLIASCDAAVAGGSVSAMEKAAQLAGKKRVLLIAEGTCLYEEMARTGDYRLPRGLSAAARALFFPPELEEEGGLFHPDRLKRHGEDVLLKRGVRFLYGCQVLGFYEGAVILAHPSGLYAAACREAWDGRGLPVPARPAYCLHTMHGGAHRVRLVEDVPSGKDPLSLFLRYDRALDGLIPGDTLARGGSDATDFQGLCPAPGGIPPLAPLPLGPHDPRRENPVQEDAPVFSLVHGLDAREQGNYDLIVAGGGTAGAPAALFAARSGLRVLLLEMNGRLGGSATLGGVSTYWFGLRSGATAQIDDEVSALCRRLGLPRKPCLWNENDTFPPDLKAHALLKLCLEAKAEVRLGCVVCGVKKTKNAVEGVYWVQNGKLFFAGSKMVLDCTGDGSLCMFSGADHTYGSEEDGMTYWASLAQYPSPDAYRNNFSTMVHLGDPRDCTRFILSARRQGGELYDHGQYLAVRESRHIRGMDTVTLKSLLSLCPPEKPLYDCFSNLDPKGRITADWAFFGLLCPNRRVSVPRGAVIPVNRQGQPIAGLLTGGKAISCTHDAFPLLRMQPDLQRQGLALAALALCAIRQGLPPWEAEGVNDAILAMGGDAPRAPSFPLLPPLSQAVAGLTGHEPWEWLDAPPDAWDDTVSPILQIMLADQQEAVPLLGRALENAAFPPLALALSRLLLWHGDDAGAPAVIAEIQRMLDACPGLPRRAASTNYGQLLPDHGLMPECVYLLNSLSRASRTPVSPLFARVLERLERGPRDWQDIRAGIYCYVESFAYAARARKDQAFVPLLERALALPEFCLTDGEGPMRERLDMLKITLLGALHALGAPRGRAGLSAYLQDGRLPFRLAARMLLDEAAPSLRAD